MSPLNTLVAIFLEPAKAMAAVRERSMVLLPLLLLILGNIALMTWYYGMVDFPWLQDQMISAMGNVPAEQAEAARGFMQRGTMMAGAVIGIGLMVPLMLVISAVYYLLVAKVMGSELGFGKWFAFNTWVTVPTLLLIPVGVVQILTHTNGQLAPEALNPLTLNTLLFQLPAGNAWAGLLNSINLTMIWSIVVAVIGFRVWMKKSTLTSIIVVLAPYVVIYGIWAAFAAMRAAA